MSRIHEHYEQLNDVEKHIVDETMKEMYKLCRLNGLILVGDDRAEVAADALANLIIQSR